MATNSIISRFLNSLALRISVDLGCEALQGTGQKKVTDIGGSSTYIIVISIIDRLGVRESLIGGTSVCDIVRTGCGMGELQAQSMKDWRK